MGVFLEKGGGSGAAPGGLKSRKLSKVSSIHADGIGRDSAGGSAKVRLQQEG